ncbi:fatty aldehyde dehydrogenase [Hyaloraphidium curvatum]|nr:fatty aldehyde dehydrogenase [Hyaloraphidium curvatum]
MAGLVFTPVDEIPKIVEEVRKGFQSGITQPVAFRKKQLVALHDLFKENIDAIADAMYKDLRKPRAEVELEGTAFCGDVIDTLEHLDQWTADTVVKPDLAYATDTTVVQYEPFGLVLNISPWNYPFVLTLAPLMGMLAAGNAVILKPSEVAANSAKLIAELVPKYLDPRVVRVIKGGVAETTRLLELQFDHILYTGNGTVAKIVASAAAKHLTPVTLELGGKSPVIVDKSCKDLAIAARRVAWGKYFNCGQTCIAPDYVLVYEPYAEEFCSLVKRFIGEFYGTDAQKSASYGRVINGNHFRRIKKILEQSKQDPDAQLIFGGRTDEADLFIEPTVVLLKAGLPGAAKNALMEGELFAPVLPVIPIKSLDEAIAYIAKNDHPLAAYVFSSDRKVVEDCKRRIHAGGFVANDVIMHFLVAQMPFGGVGPSGCGAYHGIEGFRNFSHKKSCLLRPLALEMVNDLRVAPYSEQKSAWLGWILGKKLNRNKFLNDRQGPSTLALVGAAAVGAVGYIAYKARK